MTNQFLPAAYLKKFAAIICIVVSVQTQAQFVDLRLLGTYSTSIFDEGATEIAAYDAATQRIYSVNANSSSLDVIDISDPSLPSYLFSIDLTPYGNQANSVVINAGYVAAAVEADDKQANGSVVFFDADGNYINQVEVGALPDMITNSPNGRYILVANEGEPNSDYSVDPLGTVSIIDVIGGIPALTQGDVYSVDFTAYDILPIDAAIKINGPGSSVSQDLEPEYIAVSYNSRKAYVTLQENNAIAEISIQQKKVLNLYPLGYKDHSLTENALDASDKNSSIVNITTQPVFGMYQPDAIAAPKIGNQTYLITANEGDVREYDALEEASRISSLDLDDTAFPDEATLKSDNVIGRLNVCNTLGDTDNDGDYDALYAFGARSFSIWNTTGGLVYDSGDDIEQITNTQYPANFNASNTSNTKKGRSDDKGPEPEGLTTAKILGDTYLFLGLERMGGVMIYNITDVNSPEFIEYENNRDFSVTPDEGVGGDLGPEGFLFIPATSSPTGKNLLAVSNEISGTISFYATDYSCGFNKVSVCYDGVSYCLPVAAAEDFLALGGTVGECTDLKTAEDAVTNIDANIVVYPNPAKDHVKIIFHALEAGNWNIELMDVTGKIIYNQQYATDGTHLVESIALDVQTFSAGTYFYAMYNDAGKMFTGKLMIQK
ncbi:MAG: choice-of-anchor I family protein [Fimbriimonadaceae bacterium]|nr:choice-of-anchor I family protein [Chitinophagales bacterium]